LRSVTMFDGRSSLAAASAAVMRQRHIVFGYRIVAIDGAAPAAQKKQFACFECCPVAKVARFMRETSLLALLVSH